MNSDRCRYILYTYLNLICYPRFRAHLSFTHWFSCLLNHKIPKTFKYIMVERQWKRNYHHVMPHNVANFVCAAYLFLNVKERERGIAETHFLTLLVINYFGASTVSIVEAIHPDAITSMKLEMPFHLAVKSSQLFHIAPCIVFGNIPLCVFVCLCHRWKIGNLQKQKGTEPLP